MRGKRCAPSKNWRSRLAGLLCLVLILQLLPMSVGATEIPTVTDGFPDGVEVLGKTLNTPEVRLYKGTSNSGTPITDDVTITRAQDLYLEFNWLMYPNDFNLNYPEGDPDSYTNDQESYANMLNSLTKFGDLVGSNPVKICLSDLITGAGEINFGNDRNIPVTGGYGQMCVESGKLYLDITSPENARYLLDVHMGLACKLKAQEDPTHDGNPISVTLPQGKTYNITVPAPEVQDPTVKKEAIGFNSSTGELKWKITYSQGNPAYQASDADARTFTDTLVGDGLVFTGVSYDKSGEELKISCDQSNFESYTGKTLTFTAQKDAPTTVITVTTKLTDTEMKNLAISGAETPYTNGIESTTANFVTGTQPEIKVPANTYKPSLKKGGDVIPPAAGETTTKIKWTINVDPHGMTFRAGDTLDIIDTMGKYLMPQAAGFEIYLNGEDESNKLTKGTDYAVVGGDGAVSHTVTIHLAGKAVNSSGKYVITYVTPVDSDYFGQSGTDAEKAATISNSAKAKWGFAAVNSGNTVTGEGVGEGVTISTSLIEKEAGTLTFKGGYPIAPFTIIVNQYGRPLPNTMTIEETLPEKGTDYTNGVEFADDAETIKKAIEGALTNAGITGTTVNVQPLGSNAKTFTAKISNVPSDCTKSFSFNVNVKVTDSLVLAGYVKKENNQRIPLKVYNEVEMTGYGDDNAELTVDPGVGISKDLVSYTPATAGQKAQLEMKIIIKNPNGINIGTVTVKDVLNGGDDSKRSPLIYENKADKFAYWSSNAKGSTPVAIDKTKEKITEDTPHPNWTTVEWEVELGTATEYYITFIAEVPDSDSQTEAYSGKETVEYRNDSVEILSGNTGTNVTNSMSIGIPAAPVINKEGERKDAQTNKIDYTVTLNPNLRPWKSGAADLKVVDVLHKDLMLDEDSVVLYALDVSYTVNSGKYDQGHTVTRGAKVDLSEGDVVAAKNADGTTTLTVKLPADADCKAYELTYTAYATKLEAGLTNTVTLEGTRYTSNKDNESSKTMDLSSNSGARMLVPVGSSYRTLEVQKAGPDGATLTSGVAEFELYTNADLAPAHLYGEKVTTGGDLVARFSFRTAQLNTWLNSGITKLYLKEVTAPAGYTARKDPLEISVQALKDKTNGVDALTQVFRNYPVNAANDKKIYLKKENNSGTALSGAVFGLYTDSACKQFVKQAVSNESGIVAFDALEPGKIYYIKEITAPAGYLLSTTVHRVIAGDEHAIEDEALVVKNTPKPYIPPTGTTPPDPGTTPPTNPPAEPPVVPPVVPPVEPPVVPPVEPPVDPQNPTEPPVEPPAPRPRPNYYVPDGVPEEYWDLFDPDVPLSAIDRDSVPEEIWEMLEDMKIPLADMSPDTGDHSRVLLWSTLALASLGAIYFLVMPEWKKRAKH